MEEYVLYHHGVKGQRWGVRRYQRKDGSLTAAGRRKQAREANWHEDYKNAHTKKSVKEMSTKELQQRNTRMNAEQQYRQLTKSKINGKKVVNAFVGTATTLAAIAGACVTYKKLGGQALDKMGDWVVSGIDLSGKWA